MSSPSSRDISELNPTIGLAGMLPRNKLTQRNLAVLAAGVVTFLNLYCTQAILTVLASQFHTSPLRTGLTVTTPLLAVAMIAPLIGAISDRFGRRRLIVGAAMLLILPTLLAATAQTLGQMILWRFLQGLLLPFIFTVTVAYIGDESAGGTTIKLAGTYITGAIFGGFAGRVITGIATEYFGWRIALTLIGLLTVALAWMIFIWLPAEQNFIPTRGLARALRSYKIHMGNPRLLATYAVGFGVLFSFVAVFTFINFRLAAPPFNLGPAALGLVFVVYLAGVVVTPLATRLAARIGRRPVVLAASLAGFLGFGLTLAQSLPIIIAGLAFMCCGLFVEQALATGFVGAAAREAKSTAVGLYVTFYYIGGSLGGILPAGLWRATGWTGCVALVSCMQLVMLVLVLRFWGAIPIISPNPP